MFFILYQLSNYMDVKDRIKRIQSELGVSADGIIGDKTLSAIEKELNLNTGIMKTVCICIGHSSKDEGAYSADNEIGEYSYNKNLANIIKKELDSTKSINAVIVNRLTDGGGTGMSADIKAVNSVKSECIIELHANAFNGKASGTETLYWHTSTKGKYLAQCIQDEMIKVLELPNRGIKPINGDDRGGAVLKGSYAPMVITEPFFIDNSEDLKKAITKESSLAIAIANGIIKYLYTI